MDLQDIYVSRVEPLEGGFDCVENGSSGESCLRINIDGTLAV